MPEMMEHVVPKEREMKRRRSRKKEERRAKSSRGKDTPSSLSQVELRKTEKAPTFAGN